MVPTESPVWLVLIRRFEVDFGLRLIHRRRDGLVQIEFAIANALPYPRTLNRERKMHEDRHHCPRIDGTGAQRTDDRPQSISPGTPMSSCLLTNFESRLALNRRQFLRRNGPASGAALLGLRVVERGFDYGLEPPRGRAALRAGIRSGTLCTPHPPPSGCQLKDRQYKRQDQPCVSNRLTPSSRVRPVAEGLVVGPAASAQGHLIPNLIGLAVGGNHRDASAHPNRAADLLIGVFD